MAEQTKVDFPVSQSGDSEEVVLALETGRALWGKGDFRDAVRWLRRAAEKAVRAGDSARAAGLARAATELTTQLTIPPSPVSVPRPDAHDAEPDYADTTIVERPAGSSALQQALAVARTRPRQGLRVAVETSAEEADVLVVRVLPEGQPAPAGTYEALLVALEPGVDLLQLKKKQQ